MSIEKKGLFRHTISDGEKRDVLRIAALIHDKKITIDEDDSEYPLFDSRGNLTDFGFEYIYDLLQKQKSKGLQEEFTTAMNDLGVETGDNIFPPDTEK